MTPIPPGPPVAQAGPLVELAGWGWRHAGRRAWAVCQIDFRLDPGERVLLLGPSGAGKSTLLSAIAGLLGGGDEGEEAGTIRLAGRHPSQVKGRTALVMQDPESQIILARLGDDVAFGAENLGVPRDEIWRRVASGLAAVGLDLPYDRSTEALSGGQKQRLVLAGALAMGADLLLLDEPTANLDPAGVVAVRDAVADVVADRRRGLIVVEHHSEVWADLVDRVVVLTTAGIVADAPPGEVFAQSGAELAAMGVWVPPAYGDSRDVRIRRDPGDPDDPPGGDGPGDPTAGPAGGPTGPILAASGLAIGYGTTPVLTGLDLTIPAGRSTVIVGPNGAGKTTLALTLAGLLPRLAGQIVAAPKLAARGLTDPAAWRSKELLSRIGTVFQAPEHQFVATTVRDEIAVGLRALKYPAAEIDARVGELLDALHLADVAQANPFTLSGGEKRRASVGTVLATNPAIVVLDEPTFGQDRTTWRDLVALIGTLVAGGTTVISVTHDQAYIAALGHHVIELAVS